MRDNSSEQEPEVKGEREGKFKGALRAMKRYACIAFFHSCLNDDLTQSVSKSVSQSQDLDCGSGLSVFKSIFTDSYVEFQPSYLSLIFLEYGWAQHAALKSEYLKIVYTHSVI